jgi:hypothetical protein
MSRSIKRTPIVGYSAAKSEKYDKRMANRCLRRRSREVLRTSGPGPLPLLREVSNAATFNKDGKQWLDDPDPKDLRK